MDSALCDAICKRVRETLRSFNGAGERWPIGQIWRSVFGGRAHAVAGMGQHLARQAGGIAAKIVSVWLRSPSALLSDMAKECVPKQALGMFCDGVGGRTRSQPQQAFAQQLMDGTLRTGNNKLLPDVLAAEAVPHGTLRRVQLKCRVPVELLKKPENGAARRSARNADGAGDADDSDAEFVPDAADDDDDAKSAREPVQFRYEVVELLFDVGRLPNGDRAVYFAGSHNEKLYGRALKSLTHAGVQLHAIWAVRRAASPPQSILQKANIDVDRLVSLLADRTPRESKRDVPSAVIALGQQLRGEAKPEPGASTVRWRLAPRVLDLFEPGEFHSSFFITDASVEKFWQKHMAISSPTASAFFKAVYDNNGSRAAAATN